jgi:hypothetical protein
VRKIINNRVYDTEKAHEVGDWDNGAYTTDFGYVSETLYRKRTGEYFLHGEGGARTQYAVAEGQNSWSGGSRIMPMSYDDARAWAEDRLSADDYEAEFGTPDEDDGDTAHLSLSIPSWAYKAIKSESARRGCPMGDLITEYAKSLGE